MTRKRALILLAMLAAGIHPHVPSQGSVGASGDLAPLAHLCLPLIGRGEVWNENETGKRSAAEALRLAEEQIKGQMDPSRQKRLMEDYLKQLGGRS